MRRVIVVAFVLAFVLPLTAQQDSVLVELAKRTGRLGKHPAHVITNEEVAASRGRISEATWETTAEPASAGSQSAPGVWAAADADYAKKTAQQKNVPPPRPVVIEGSTRASYSMPPATAQNATVASTAANVTPQSTAQNAPVRTISVTPPPQQTAPTTNPPVVTPTKVD